jgi:thiosulfate/3-mercaptopyruvate sulfurtransferase
MEDTMTRKTLALIFTGSLALPGLALAAPEGWQPLLEPAQLAQLLATNDIRVVHVTGDYAAGHIPDALWSPYAAWRSDAPNPGALRDLGHLQTVVRELGIDTETPVVVVHGGANPTDMGAAARVYWTLKSLGVTDLALLNGGFAGWTAAGLPVQTAPASALPSDFTASWREDWRVTSQEVAELAAEGRVPLVDSRPNDFFTGITWTAAAPGTVQNAQNLTFSTFFDGNRLRDADTVRSIAAEHGLTEVSLTVSFCNTGHWAAINWFALSEVAGIENVRLHAESMAEYTALGLPLDNAPSRLAYYWRSTSRWVQGFF